jgi:PAS domain S-box-containing protein
VGQLIYDLGNKQWDIPKLRELLENILPRKATFDNYEVEHEFSTIGRRVMLLNARQIQRIWGKERIILLAIEDITERKEIEAGREKTRQELAAIKRSADEAHEFADNVINTVREPLISLNQDLRVVTVSRSFYDFFKVKPEETVGQLIYDLGNKQWDIPKLRELLENILPQRTAFDNYEVEHEFSTIGRRVVLLNARQIFRENIGSHIILLAMEDITERKQAEKEKAKLEGQNRQLQKAESLSVMAGAIAHHINNQLGAVIGNLEMALEDLPQDAAPVKNLTSAMKASRRAVEIGGHMLTYLGQTDGIHAPLDLSETCRQSLPLLQAANPHGLILKVDLPSTGPTISANANQLRQVLTNLVTNAWDAVEENKGTLYLTVKMASPSEMSAAYRFPSDWQPQDGIPYACLEVKDNGCGIAGEDIDKVFDPFFSSKFTGRGLGLPMVLGIVKAHQGVITVESELGRGSCFRVLLPVSTAKIAQQLPTTAQPLATNGSGTVLLVDDEELLREMAAARLTRLGYEVIESKNGLEALEMFRLHQEKVRCVLTDLTMPFMDGWEVLAAVRKLSPNIPVILSSGYDEAEVKTIFGDHPERPQAFLHKPYQKEELQAALAKAMEGKLYPEQD